MLTVYSKGGGNRGKHGYVDDVDAITAASNIVIQMYQYQGIGTRFTEKPLSSHPFPQLQAFDLIPSTSFLCALSTTPTAVEGGLQISQEDLQLFKSLRAQPDQISTAIKAFKKAKAKQKDNGDSEEEDIEVVIL